MPGAFVLLQGRRKVERPRTFPANPAGSTFEESDAPKAQYAPRGKDRAT
jgi:hypothetical protein